MKIQERKQKMDFTELAKAFAQKFSARFYTAKVFAAVGFLFSLWLKKL